MGRPIHKEDAMGNEFTGFEDNAPTLTLEPDWRAKGRDCSRAGSRSCEKGNGTDRSLPGRTADGRQLC
mgnify:FL=1